MIDEEIYILVKHGKFQADYIESIPIYKRRYFLHLMEKEKDEIEKIQNSYNNKMPR